MYIEPIDSTTPSYETRPLDYLVFTTIMWRQLISLMVINMIKMLTVDAVLSIRSNWQWRQWLKTSVQAACASEALLGSSVGSSRDKIQLSIANHGQNLTVHNPYEEHRTSHKLTGQNPIIWKVNTIPQQAIQVFCLETALLNFWLFDLINLTSLCFSHFIQNCSFVCLETLVPSSFVYKWFSELVFPPVQGSPANVVPDNYRSCTNVYHSR